MDSPRIRIEFLQRAEAQADEFGLDRGDVIKAVAGAMISYNTDPHYSSVDKLVVVGSMPDGSKIKVQYSERGQWDFAIANIEYWKRSDQQGDGRQ
jgi:hypothetical protein